MPRRGCAGDPAGGWRTAGPAERVGTPDTEHGYAAAAAALGAAPATVRRLLAGMAPSEAWDRLQAGEHPADPAGRFRTRACSDVPHRVAEACARTETRVVLLGDPGYPAMLAGDLEAPAVLFVTGDAAASAAADGPGRARVAVVGTRAPSSTGTQVAWALGEQLADTGVTVVSGLARGIDAAAHGGALASGGAPVVGVLGAAVDAPLAPADARLRAQVAAGGVLLSEVPPGVPSSRWMFAVRNRLMAAAAHAVVVVESHASGGSLHTVRAALRRGVVLCAVPGSVHSPSSSGSNSVLVDGRARAVRDGADVLAIIRNEDRGVPGMRLSAGVSGRSEAEAAAGVSGRSRGEVTAGVPNRSESPAAGGGSGVSPRVSDAARAVLAALDGEPATVDRVALRCSRPLGAVALGLEQLADAGLATHEHGWWTRVAPVRRR